jgi:predicted PurR-regulated permease PerM
MWFGQPATTDVSSENQRGCVGDYGPVTNFGSLSGPRSFALPMVVRGPSTLEVLGFIFLSLRRPHISQRKLAALTCTILALYTSVLVLRPFLAPISWAVTLAIIVFPLYRSLEHLLTSHTLRATLVTGFVAATVILPAIWVLHSLVIAAITGLDSLVPNPLQHLLEKILQTSPEVSRAYSSLRDALAASGLPERATTLVAQLTESFIGSSLRGVGHACLMIFIIFFLLRDGPLFVRGVERLIPLSDSDTAMLLGRITDTVHATLLGMIAVAILQGTLGALLLWWLGIPGVIVWGAIMALLALVPYLGTFVVWIPIAASLAMQGDWMRMSVTLLWGGVVIALSDNILYPHIVGQRLHYHSLVVFFFLLGGVLTFGAAGAVLGPVILAVTDRLLWIWGRGERGEEREVSG